MPTALPGDPLGPSSKFRPGAGTHLHASQLHASLLGPVSRSSAPPLPTDTPNAKPSPNPALTIAAQRNPNSSFVSKSSTTLPEVNTIVLGRVTRLRQREAVVEILVSDDEVLETGSFQGVVMSQDVRATEKDRVKIREMFRVGDIVRGIVVSAHSTEMLCSVYTRRILRGTELQW